MKGRASLDRARSGSLLLAEPGLSNVVAVSAMRAAKLDIFGRLLTTTQDGGKTFAS